MKDRCEKNIKNKKGSNKKTFCISIDKGKDYKQKKLEELGNY